MFFFSELLINSRNSSNCPKERHYKRRSPHENMREYRFSFFILLLFLLIFSTMDFSANLHHQLLQLENQLLLGSGSGHAWTPDISLSPSYEFEPNFHFQDLNPAAIDAESFTSLQDSSHGISKDDDKFEDQVKEEEIKGSACCHKITNNINNETNNLNKIAAAQSCCCCSKIHPTVNVSSRKPPLMADFSSSLGFDHHSSSFASSHHLFHQSKSSSLLTKRPSHEITQAKRPCTLKQQKPTQATLKKSRVEPRAACPPLKIRKEKLGDRIAALQQLVAPFGKTDTASVLMEAISYINFLQTQVEMLSHCYMKSCRSKNYRTICRDELNEKDKKSESDLKAKGLCLVPLTCISYLPEDTSNGGRIGSIWPPLAAANFNRRTF